jgi:hypothetical protein
MSATFSLPLQETVNPGAAATASGAIRQAGACVELTHASHNKHGALRPLVVRVLPVNGGTAFTVAGQTARAIVALHRAGPAGLTALEVNSWAYRLSAYCFNLRKKGLTIVTEREEHAGGWHGRYVLHTPIQIEPVSEGAAQ